MSKIGAEITNVNVECAIEYTPVCCFMFCFNIIQIVRFSVLKKSGFKFRICLHLRPSSLPFLRLVRKSLGFLSVFLKVGPVYLSVPVFLKHDFNMNANLILKKKKNAAEALWAGQHSKQ